MSIVNHEFTDKIIEILNRHSGDCGRLLLKGCEIIQYLNIKTKAANRGSKSRAGFANHYAIYVLVEDYINGGFNTNGGYADYEVMDQDEPEKWARIIHPDRHMPTSWDGPGDRS